MNYDLASNSIHDRKTCLVYPGSSLDIMQEKAVSRCVINWALRKPWLQNYLTNDKFAIINEAGNKKGERKRKKGDRKNYHLCKFQVPMQLTSKTYISLQLMWLGLHSSYESELVTTASPKPV